MMSGIWLGPWRTGMRMEDPVSDGARSLITGGVVVWIA